ncbi:MAG: hypothetical protein ILP02_01395, partial [Clostridia bacterium]|nr:hypothetical protein [Clostridia bacterium]
MVSGATLIEKLLSYAADNLYLAPADEYFKRVVLCKLMNVDPRSVTEKRHAGVGLSAVKAELDAYATENKLNADGDLSLLIFGCLTPLNSSIEKSFKLFREKFSASKAREYYFGLMKNCGYVSERDFSPVLGRHGKINLCTANGFVVKESAYRPDERYVRLNLVRDYLFGYDKYYDFAEQGNLIIADGVKFSSEEDGLDDIFEFIDYMPDYCVYAGRSEVGANAERLTTFKERPSALDAEVRFSFRHEA